MCVHKKRDKLGRVLLMLTAGLMAAGLVAARARAQSFVLSQNGKSIGNATLAVRPTQGGQGALEITSGSKINMTGLNYSFTATQGVNASYQLQHVQLSGVVNGTAATVNATAQEQNRQAATLQVKINASGKVTQTPLAYHPLAVFWPDFDPGALQIALEMGAANNNRDLWALVPKQTGSIQPLKIATKADEQGTLSGKLIKVHHVTISLDTSSVEVFSSPANELLQAEWTDDGFAMVRQGFQIKPPARPGSPPPAAPQQDSGAGAAQPQNQ